MVLHSVGMCGTLAKMSETKSHLTPARIFGTRVREIREHQGLKQGELADMVRIDRTTLNKIERGVRGDISISQLFRFAVVLRVSPVHLLTPRSDEGEVEIDRASETVMSAADARIWIGGGPPPGADPLRWFVSLPPSEQWSLIDSTIPDKDRLALQLVGGLDATIRARLVDVHAEEKLASELERIRRLPADAQGAEIDRLLTHNRRNEGEDDG